MKKTYKSASRDLYFHKGRSLVIIIAVIFIIAFPLALQNLAPNLRETIELEQEEYKLSHFNFIFAGYLPARFIENITFWVEDELGRPVSAELARIQLVHKYQISSGDWLQADLVSINDFENPSLNLMQVDAGRAPLTENEVAVLTSFGEKESIPIGSEVELQTPIGIQQFKVTGYIRSIEFASYGLIQRGLFFFNTLSMNKYLGLPLDSDLRNSFLIYIDGEVSLEEERRVIDRVNLEVEKLVEQNKSPPISFPWLTRRVSFRQSLSDALDITSKYMIVSTIFIFLIAGSIIFVVMHRYVQDQKVIIGAMYAYGIHKQEIILSYVYRTSLLYLVGSIIGYYWGKLLLDKMTAKLADSWGLFGYKTGFSLGSLVFTFFSAYVILILFTLLALKPIFALTPYEAMRGRGTDLKSSRALFKLSSIVRLRAVKYGLRNLFRSRTRTVLTTLSFILALTFSASIMYTDYSTRASVDVFFEKNVNFEIYAHTGFEDAANLTRLSIIKQVDNVASVEPRFQLFGNIKGHPELVTYLVGLEYGSKAFTPPIIKGRNIQQNTSEILISNYIANVYGYSIGQVITLTIFNKEMNFTVVGIHNDSFQTISIIADLDYLSSQFLVPGTNATYSQLQIPMYNILMITLKDKSKTQRTVNLLNTEYEWIEYALSVEVIHRQQKSFVESQIQVVYILVLLGLIVAFMTVFTTQFISMVERDLEFGMLQVFGKYKQELYRETLVEVFIVWLTTILAVFVLSPIVAEQIWIGAVANQILYVTFYVSGITQVFIGVFGLISLLISHALSFRWATSLKPHEVIREE